MIQQINQTDGLKKYITHEIEDAGLAVAVDSKLNLDEYIGIKVDDYYMGLPSSSVMVFSSGTMLSIKPPNRKIR